jgi:arylsulfatase A-like enzyme
MRSFLACVLSIGCAVALPAQSGSRDNVLLVIVDDLGVDGVGAYAEGSAPPPTPNLDALAQRGVLFRNAWSNPMCTVSRACIQTGRHGFRTGVGHVIPGNDLRRNEITLPEQLDARRSGYAHAAIGKWHLSNPSAGPLAPNQAGWSHFAGVVVGFSDYFQWDRTVDGATAPSTDYATTRMVDDALAWITAQTGPWVCQVALVSPHSPYHEPPAHLHTQNLQGRDPRTEPIPFFKAMVEAMDNEIGRLLAGLGPALANTNVIFVADNGTDPAVVEPPFAASRAKGTVYEGGVNVPLIVAGPAVVSGGRELPHLVHLVDLYATVLELAKVDPEPLFARTDSVSIVPYLRDPAALAARTTVYSELFDDATLSCNLAAIRNDRFKLVRVACTGGQLREELYDLASDPFEANDLLQTRLSASSFENLVALSAELERLKTVVLGFATYGPTGCAGTGGQATIRGMGAPRIGQRYAVLLDNGPSSRPAVLHIGGSRHWLGALELPFALSSIGAAPGCDVVASREIAESMLCSSGGFAALQLRLPLDRWLIGASIYHQWLMIDPGAPGNALGVTVTQGLQVVVGE